MNLTNALEATRLLVAAVVILASLTVALPAGADIIPDDVAACQHAIEGTPCSTRNLTAGVCEPDTCSRLNYGVPDGPRSESYDCLRCEPATIASLASPFTLAITGGSVIVGGLLAFFVHRRRNRYTDDGDDL